MPSNLTFDELAALLVADYRLQGLRSLSSAENSVKQLRQFFGGECPAGDLTYQRLMAYAAHRLEQKRARATVRKELAALKRAFHLARRGDPTISQPVFPEIKVQNARHGFIDRAGLDCLMREAPVYLKGLLLFLYVTGWRRSEALGLRWSQVDFETGIVRLEPGTTKNGEGREFPFGQIPDLVKMLRAQLDWTHKIERKRQMVVPWVFSKNGRRMQWFRKAWKNACKNCGLVAGRAGFVPHDFRRTAVRNLERGHVERKTAMSMTGHLTEAIYLRYAITHRDDLTRGGAKLAVVLREEAQASEQVVLPLRSRN